MFLALLERPAEPVVMVTRGLACVISASWMADSARTAARNTQRIELVPGFVVVRLKRWLPTSALDVAEQLPWEHDAIPVKRILPFPDWHVLAACRGVDAAVFFGAPAAMPPFSRGALRSARDICRSCPVARTCLTHALSQPEQYGVWAGTSGGQRARLAERIRAGAQLTEVVEQCLMKLSRSARPRRAVVRAAPRSVTSCSPIPSPAVAEAG